jgi:hypothetical protein
MASLGSASSGNSGTSSRGVTALLVARRNACSPRKTVRYAWRQA